MEVANNSILLWASWLQWKGATFGAVLLFWFWIQSSAIVVCLNHSAMEFEFDFTQNADYAKYPNECKDAFIPSNAIVSSCATNYSHFGGDEFYLKATF